MDCIGGVVKGVGIGGGIGMLIIMGGTVGVLSNVGPSI